MRRPPTTATTPSPALRLPRTTSSVSTCARAGASGWDAAATIRRLALATRILLFTETRGALDHQRAGRAGVALVRTPIVLPELTAALRQALPSSEEPAGHPVASRVALS